MKHRLGLALVSCAVMVAVIAAQDDPARVPKDGGVDNKRAGKKGADDLPPVKELEKKEPVQRPEGGDDPERFKKIIERLHKNMDSSEERLKKEDPGEDTRKIQGDIVKDLDELIKQQGQGGGGGGGGGGSSKSGKGSKGGSGGSGNAGSSAAGGSKGGSQTKQNGKGGANQKNNPANAQNGQKKNNPDKLGKDDAKDKQSAQREPGKGEHGKGEPGKEGKGGDGMGGNPNAKDQKEKNTITDLFKDVWGHLPQNKRQEMDAYAKERFLRKYEEILRQYYRTISEQGRRQDGE